MNIHKLKISPKKIFLIFHSKSSSFHFFHLFQNLALWKYYVCIVVSPRPVVVFPRGGGLNFNPNQNGAGVGTPLIY